MSRSTNMSRATAEWSQLARSFTWSTQLPKSPPTAILTKLANSKLSFFIFCRLIGHLSCNLTIYFGISTNHDSTSLTFFPPLHYFLSSLVCILCINSSFFPCIHRYIHSAFICFLLLLLLYLP